MPLRLLPFACGVKGGEQRRLWKPLGPPPADHAARPPPRRHASASIVRRCRRAKRRGVGQTMNGRAPHSEPLPHFPSPVLLRPARASALPRGSPTRTTARPCHLRGAATCRTPVFQQRARPPPSAPADAGGSPYALASAVAGPRASLRFFQPGCASVPACDYGVSARWAIPTAARRSPSRGSRGLDRERRRMSRSCLHRLPRARRRPPA